jgi:hypothetical protein
MMSAPKSGSPAGLNFEIAPRFDNEYYKKNIGLVANYAARCVDGFSGLVRWRIFPIQRLAGGTWDIHTMGFPGPACFLGFLRLRYSDPLNPTKPPPMTKRSFRF